MHASTGNDYASPFSRKGKKRCWEVAISNPFFLAAFAKLGDDWNLEEQVISTAGEYVCCIFGSKKKFVDIVRVDMFLKKRINVKTK